EPAHFKIQGVTVHDLDATSGEMLAQKIRKTPIFFDCQNLCARFEHRFGQRAETRTNFQNEIFRRQLRLLHDPTRKILIVKKILTERLYWRDLNLAQG